MAVKKKINGRRNDDGDNDSDYNLKYWGSRK